MEGGPSGGVVYAKNIGDKCKELRGTCLSLMLIYVAWEVLPHLRVLGLGEV